MYAVGVLVVPFVIMLIVEQGKVVDMCAEPGEFVYDAATEPSIFTGDLADSVMAVFENVGKRFTFGGEAPMDQRVYFVNTKELVGNKYGTPSPVPFRVVDQRAGIDIDIAIRCFGEYSYRVVNPLLFYANVCGNVEREYTREEIDSQLKSELLTALQPAFARISAMGVRYSELPGKTLELAEAEPLLLEATQDIQVPDTPAAGADFLDAGLTEEEQRMVDEFSQKIDLTNSAIVLQYGAACQKKVADFSDNALEGVRTKDLGPAGEMIADLVGELKGFSVEDDEGGIFGLFKKAGNKIARLKTRYDKAEVNIDRIAGELEGHQNQLISDIVMLDKMYEANLLYFKELSMYILAGKKRLEHERTVTLPELKAAAQASGQAHDAQAANDLAAMCDRFEKKLHDLELTRTISMQMAPQIRLIQNNNALMAEKIQSTLNNTIPLWKNQMVLALGLAHSKQAMEAQREVTDLTNELLRKNADTLKAGTVEVAQESERGIVDMETVVYTNEQLIATLDEVLRIHEEGRQKRQAAEAELARIETELKQKLLDIRE